MADDTDFDDEFFDLVLYHSEPGGGRVTLGPAAEWNTWWRVAARHAGRAGLASATWQGFVLSTTGLRRSGLTRQQVRTKVKHGVWSAPRPGFVGVVDTTESHGVGSDRWSVARREHALACSAASLSNPGFVVSRESAAILAGLPTLTVPSPPQLTAAPDLHSRRQAAARIDADEHDDWYGVPLTAVARTVVDIARHDRRDGIVTADAALCERLTDPGSLERAIGRAAGWFGVRQAREIVALADGRSESPLESVTRLKLHDAGFPAPQPQFEIAVPGRRVPYRVDFCWPDRRLVLECDGRVKYREDQRWKEKRREIALRRAGYRVERVLWTDVFEQWATTEAYLRTLFCGPVPAHG